MGKIGKLSVLIEYYRYVKDEIIIIGSLLPVKACIPQEWSYNNNY